MKEGMNENVNWQKLKTLNCIQTIDLIWNSKSTKVLPSYKERLWSPQIIKFKFN